MLSVAAMVSCVYVPVKLMPLQARNTSYAGQTAQSVASPTEVSLPGFMNATVILTFEAMQWQHMGNMRYRQETPCLKVACTAQQDNEPTLEWYAACLYGMPHAYWQIT